MLECTLCVCLGDPIKNNLPKCQGLTYLLQFLLGQGVPNMFHDLLCPEHLVLFELLIPKHQHVVVVSPYPSRLEHLKIPSQQDVPLAIQLFGEHTEVGVEVRVLEESVVVVVRDTGVLHISTDKYNFGHLQEAGGQQLEGVVRLESEIVND